MLFVMLHENRVFFFAVLYCRQWPVRLYHIFPYYLINGRQTPTMHMINICEELQVISVKVQISTP
jgi:hypothetical protein